MADDEIRLALKVDGSDTAAQLAKNIEMVKAEGVELAAQLSKGEINLRDYKKAAAEVASDLRILEGAHRVTARAELEQAEASRHLGVATENLGDAMGTTALRTHVATTTMTGAMNTAGKAGVNMGQSMLQGGRVVQDFFQGGIGGILNNIEGMTVALGMGPGMAGALTIIGVAASIAGPKIMEFLSALSAGGTTVLPKATTGLEAYERQIKETSKELDTLREKARLSFDELQRYYELEYQHKEGTAKAGAAKAADSFAGGMTTEQSEYAQAAKTVRDKLGGGDSLKKAIKEYVEKELGVVVQAARTEIITDISGRSKTVEHPEVRGFKDLKDGTFTNTAEETTNQFMEQLGKGDKSTFNLLGNKLKGAGGGMFKAHDPEVIKGIDKDNKEEEQSIEEAQRKAADDTRERTHAENEAKQKAAHDKREREQKQEHDRKEAEARDKAIAQARLANPEQTEAMLGPEALHAAARVVGGGAGHGGGGAGPAAPHGIAGPMAGAAWGGGGGAPANVRAAIAPAAGPVPGMAVGGGFEPQGLDRPNSSAKGKKAQRAERVRLAKEEKQKRDMQRTFQHAVAKPLANTSLARPGAGGANPERWGMIDAQTQAEEKRKATVAARLAAARTEQDARRAAAVAKTSATIAGVKPRAPSVPPRAPGDPVRLDRPGVDGHHAAKAPPPGNAWHQPQQQQQPHQDGAAKTAQMGQAALGAVGALNGEVAKHDAMLNEIMQKFQGVARQSTQRSGRSR